MRYLMKHYNLDLYKEVNDEYQRSYNIQKEEALNEIDIIMPLFDEAIYITLCIGSDIASSSVDEYKFRHSNYSGFNAASLIYSASHIRRLYPTKGYEHFSSSDILRKTYVRKYFIDHIITILNERTDSKWLCHNKDDEAYFYKENISLSSYIELHLSDRPAKLLAMCIIPIIGQILFIFIIMVVISYYVRGGKPIIL